jgi:hypothetical protein
MVVNICHHEKRCVACIASNTQEYKGPFVLQGVACYTSDTPAVMVCLFLELTKNGGLPVT